MYPYLCVHVHVFVKKKFWNSEFDVSQPIYIYIYWFTYNFCDHHSNTAHVRFHQLEVLKHARYTIANDFFIGYGNNRITCAPGCVILKNTT